MYAVRVNAGINMILNNEISASQANVIYFNKAAITMT